MNRLMVITAEYGGALKLVYDFEGEMDEERLISVLREKGIIFRNKVRYREKLRWFDRAGWEVLDGRGKPIYVAFVGKKPHGTPARL